MARIVDPAERTLEAYRLDAGAWRSRSATSPVPIRSLHHPSKLWLLIWKPSGYLSNFRGPLQSCG